MPDANERAAIAQATGMSVRSVQVWFQNRRQRQKAAEGMPGDSPGVSEASHGNGVAVVEALEGEDEPSAPLAASQPPSDPPSPLGKEPRASLV